MFTGKQWGVECSVQTDVPADCELVRLTDSARVGGYACHMYLNVPTFTADGRQLVFVSTRSAADPSGKFHGQNLFTCDLETGAIVQVTDVPDAHMHGGWFDPKSNWHYFWRKSGWLSRANIATGQVEDLRHEAGNVFQKSMIGLTCDGRHVIYAVSADEDKQPGPPIFTLYRLDLRTRERHQILAAGFRISHVQCSPTDPDFILYNWECMTAARKDYVPVMMRMWWCNLAGTAGGPFGNQRCNEGRTHEFFSADGRFVGYHGALHDPAGPPTDESVRAFTFGWVSTSNGRDWRQLVFDKPMGHSQLSSDGKLIVCDKCGDHHVGLIVDEDPPRYLPLYAHGSSLVGQHTHPHPQFRPDSRQIVFSTDRALLGGKEGCSDVYLLSLRERP